MKTKKNTEDNVKVIPYVLMLLTMTALALLALYIALGGLIQFGAFIFSGGGDIIEFLRDYFISFKIPLIVSVILGFGLLGAFHHYGFINNDTISDKEE